MPPKLTDETVRELLKRAEFIGDSLMVAVCQAALMGNLEAQNQLSNVWSIMNHDPSSAGRRRGNEPPVNGSDPGILSITGKNQA